MQRVVVVLALLLIGCGPFRLTRNGEVRAGEVAPGEQQPAGPVIELGSIPSFGGDEVAYVGFRSTDGQTCVRSDMSMSCWEGERRPGTLPAASADGLSWSGGGEEWCAEAEVQDGVERVAVVDADRISRDLTHLPGSRQLGVNLFVGCWTGAEPRVLDVYRSGNDLAYRQDM